MQSRTWLYLAAVALATGCAPPADEQAEGAAPPAAESATAADEAAIEALRTEYATHFNLRHPDAVAALYADSATISTADGVIAHSRAEILAATGADIGRNVTLDLQGDEVMVVGDYALSRGRWTVTPAEGSEMPGALSGNYVSVASKQGGTWQITYLVTNYEAPPPEGVPAPPPHAHRPAEEGTMKELAAAYTQAFNAGDAAAVAALYTEDSFLSLANQSTVTGRAEIRARFTEYFAAGQSTIEIHDVRTVDTGNGWAIDAGWITVTPAGAQASRGTYVLLVQQQPDGSWKIHRALNNLNVGS